MIKYSMKTAKNGRPMYFKNGKPCAAKNVPEALLKQLENGTTLTVDSEPVAPNGLEQPGGTTLAATNPNMTVDEQQPDQAQSDQPKVCIFCGESSTRQRYINQLTIELCDNDYDTHTTGEIMEQVNKVKQTGKSKGEGSNE